MILALAATAEAMHITEDTQRRAGASRRRSASSLPLRPTRVHGVGEAIGAGLRVAQLPPSRQAHPCHRGAEEEERRRLRNHRWGSRLATCENLDVQGSPSRAQSKQQGSRTGVLNVALGPDERLEITPPAEINATAGESLERPEIHAEAGLCGCLPRFRSTGARP
jgi:hypothetical protein